jgi:hypothetical protein
MVALLLWMGLEVLLLRIQLEQESVNHFACREEV